MFRCRVIKKSRQFPTVRTSQALGMPGAYVPFEALAVHREATCDAGVDIFDIERSHLSNALVNREVHSHARRREIIRKRIPLENRNFEREADEL